jgi:hypothetical protein
MSNLTESTIQNAAIEWLQELGYQHQAGKTLQGKRMKKY